MEDFQSRFKQAFEYAAVKHNGQMLPGTSLPYVVHITNVAFEVMIAGLHTGSFDNEFAVVVALLHDVMEDTEASYIEVRSMFGERIAEGVLALTKFSNLEKSYQLLNSLDRIKMLDKEVWAVKLADRITNLQAPPLDWQQDKRQRYLEGSLNILAELGPGNPYLALRLQEQIDQYTHYVITGEKTTPNVPYTP